MTERMFALKIKYGIWDKIFVIANTLVLGLFAFICFYPFYYIFINSISSPTEITRGVFLYPRGITLETYAAVLRTPGVFWSTFISVSRTVLGTVICVACSSFLAYLFAQPQMMFRKFLYRFVVLTMYIGAGFIPYYLLITSLHLRNNFLVYIIPGAVSAYYIILIKTYIESIPASLQESAEIDGAGIMTIFTKIIFPLCLPIVACVATFCAVGQWNVWSDTLYFVTDKNLYTLQYKLYTMLMNNMSEAVSANNSANVGESFSQQLTPTALRLTMTFVTILPVLCVYPFMQRYFMKGIMLGAVKG